MSVCGTLSAEMMNVKIKLLNNLIKFNPAYIR